MKRIITRGLVAVLIGLAALLPAALASSAPAPAGIVAQPCYGDHDPNDICQ